MGIKLFHDTRWVLTYTHWVFNESLGIMWVPTEYHKEISYQNKIKMTIFSPCKGPWEWALWESGPCWGLPCGDPYSHKALTPGLNLHSRSSISFIGLAGVREVRHTLNHPMNTRVTLRQA